MDYIPTESGNIVDKFVTSLIWSLGSLDVSQIQKAKEYYNLYIESDINKPKTTLWAFISWSTTKEQLI